MYSMNETFLLKPLQGRALLITQLAWWFIAISCIGTSLLGTPILFWFGATRSLEPFPVSPPGTPEVLLPWFWNFFVWHELILAWIMFIPALWLYRLRPNLPIMLLATTAFLVVGQDRSLQVTLLTDPGFYAEFPMYSSVFTQIVSVPVHFIQFLHLVLSLLVTFIFPDGRFVSEKFKWIFILFVTISIFWILFPSLPFNRINSQNWMDSPFSAAVTAGILASVFLVGIFSQWLRFQRVSNTSEKQQVKWTMLGMLGSILGSFIYFDGPRFTEEIRNSSLEFQVFYQVIRPILQLLFVSLLPICFSIAILRHRLYLIDIILNRTLVYGGISILTLLTYAVLTMTFGQFFGVQNNFWFLLAAIVLVAVGFRSFEQFIQRWLFGERNNPVLAIQQLEPHLSSTGDAMTQNLAQTIAQILKLPFVRITTESDGPMEFGRQMTPVHVFPVSVQHKQVGLLEVGLRSPSEALDASDVRTLEMIAQQLGTVTQTFMLSEELRQANAQLLEARESERQRLRDDLHDGVLGALSGMKMKLGVLEMQQSNHWQSSELLSAIMRDLEHTQSDVRRLVNGLHASALETLGLHGALEQYVGSHGGLRIELRTEGISPQALPLEVQAVALRIAQEAITNVIKHAQAKRCLVSIRLEATGLLLEIEDDGVGLPALLPSGQGLRSMRERASRVGGLLEVGPGARDAGRGTRVRAQLPLQALGNE
jgi:signal transduction histidine kinase